MFAYILVIVAIVGSQNVVAQVGLGMGKIYGIQIIHAKPCEGHKGMVDIEAVSLDNGQIGLTMDIDLPIPMDDRITYEVRMDKIQNGQIMKNVFRYGNKTNNACVDLDTYLGDWWRNVWQAMGAGQGCPIPAGKYHIENYPFTGWDLGIKEFHYGRFLLYLEMYVDGEKVVCQQIEFINERPGESQ